MTPYRRFNKSDNKFYVKLSKDGESKEITIMKLVAEHFIGECPVGQVPYHINGIQSDNHYRNIAYINRSRLGKLTGTSSNSKRVVKIAKSGDLLNFYPSARACAREENINRQVITDYCNGDRKLPFNKDFDFAWEDNQHSIRFALERLNKNKRNPRTRKVIAKSKDGKIIKFQSVKEAADTLHYNYGFVLQCVNGDRRCNDYDFKG